MKKGSWNLYLGKIRGISLYLHWTFFILLVWIFFAYYNKAHSWKDGLLAVAFVASLFTCIVLHELGHALTAKRFGCQTRKITLLPIGGVAQMEKIPEKPWQEFLVAIAGPWVNIIIAAILFVILASTSGVPSLAKLEDLNAGNFFYNLFVANIALVVFNLVPAFPMDGGRVLRSLLSMRLGRMRATRIASVVGQVFAAIFILVGIFFDFWLVIIGTFIYIGARSEAAFEFVREDLQHYKVRDILMHKFTTFLPTEPVSSVVKIVLDSQEKNFVVALNGEVLGILTQKELIRGLSEGNNQSAVSDFMEKKFLPLHSEMNLQEAYEQMTLQNQQVCPVIANGRLEGMLDMDNIIEFLLVRKFRKAQ